MLRSMDLYRARLDKQYSVADCCSMLICRDRGITDVLTHDHDFAQEGFTILL
jgi:predicted nucleic acid-binding protein